MLQIEVLKKQRKRFSPYKTVYGEHPSAIFFMCFSKKNLKVNSIIMRLFLKSHIAIFIPYIL